MCSWADSIHQPRAGNALKLRRGRGVRRGVQVLRRHQQFGEFGALLGMTGQARFERVASVEGVEAIGEDE